MKQFKDYKKLYRKILFILLLCIPLIFTSAQTIEELKTQIDNKSSDIAKIEQEIAIYKKELEELSKNKNTLSSLIKQLDLNQKKLSADINLTQKKIDQNNLKISSLMGEIDDKQESIGVNTEALSIDIKQIYENQENSIVEKLLSHESLTNTWNDLDNMRALREKIIEKINHLKKTKNELEDTRDISIEAKKELEILKSKLSDQRKIIENNKKEKDRVLKETKNNEANYQKLLKEQTARKLALEKEIQDYESKIKFILDPSSLPARGVFSWPLENVYITQLFGKTASSGRLYASGTHSGVDFRASVGTPVFSMADGIVLGAGDTDTTCAGASFGKWIFIEYNNGLASTHGHMSFIKVTPGQKVSRGEVIGYSGATGRVTGPHLHLTVYAPNGAQVETLPSKSCPGKTLTQPIAATNAYLDPMYYLPPYK